MKKALIVDDEENARLYLAAILHELYPEMEIQLAASPTEAIFLISKKCPDLILLDVEMPGMSGLELLREMRDSIKQTPVIFVSSYKRAEFIQNAMRLNAIDYIDKPVDPAELKSAIEKSCISSLTQNTQASNHKLKLFTEKGEMLFEPNEIMYFESHKRDAIAHFVNGFQNVKVRCNLKALEAILPSDVFMRSSRQCIVNKQFIKFTSQSNRSITLMEGCKSIVIDRVNPEFFKKLK
jgi:DNA-binding LytR/AlgR family response regulator